jgi:prophage regulatory protein
MSKYLRICDVVKKTGLGKSTIWSWQKLNKFPKSIKLSNRVTVWNESEIDSWLKNIAGKQN